MAPKQKTQPATKKDVKKIVTKVVNQAAEAIINGMNTLHKELKTDVKGLKKDVNELKSGQSDIRRQLTDLKVDTPTRKEFTDLKSHVNQYHPLS